MDEKRINKIIMDLDVKDICYTISINNNPSIESPFSTEVVTYKKQIDMNEILKKGKNNLNIKITKSLPNSYLKFVIKLDDKVISNFEWIDNSKTSIKSSENNEKNLLLNIPKDIVLKIKINTKEILDKVTLSYYKPLVKSGDFNITDSKFGGTPFINKDEKWLICNKCGKPMQFFLQLNLKEISFNLKKDFGKGLLQLFACVSGKEACYNDLITIIIEPINSASGEEVPKTGVIIKPKTITGWKEGKEVPDYEDLLQFTQIQENSEEANMFEKYQDKTPKQFDKLGGWRFKIQSSDTPECPICKEKMNLLFQLFSDEHIEYMFGDSGAVYIFQCLIHKDKIESYWECS